MDSNHDLRDFTPGHYHSAKAPFCSEYWLISCFLYAEFIRCIFIYFFKKNYTDPPSLKLRRVRADKKGFEPLTIGLTSRCSAVELFIHCWPGEIRTCLPAGRLTTPRLKAGYICQLSYRPFLEKRPAASRGATLSLLCT